MAIPSQGPSGFQNAETALGGGDSVPDTPDVPNPGSSGQLVRKGTSTDEVGRGRPGGRAAGLSVASMAALLAVIAIVLLMLFGGLSLPLSRH
jgi:hypothetical protein